MGSRRVPSGVIGWLGIVAVVSNLLAGTLGYVTAKSSSVVDDILGPVIICTAHGPQTLYGGNDPAEPGSGGSHCAMCAVLAAVAAAAVAFAVTAVLFPTRIFPRLRSRARTLADHIGLGGIRSRAPPLPA